MKQKNEYDSYAYMHKMSLDTQIEPTKIE